MRRQLLERISRERLARRPNALEEVVDAPQFIRGVDLGSGVEREVLDERGRARRDTFRLPRQLERDRCEDFVAEGRRNRLSPERFVGLIEELKSRS